MYMRTDLVQGQYQENSYSKMKKITTRLKNKAWANPQIKKP
jgi:hypothetical protein